MVATPLNSPTITVALVCPKAALPFQYGGLSPTTRRLTNCASTTPVRVPMVSDPLIVSPVRSSELMLGKVLPNIALCLVSTLMTLAIARLLFNVPVMGSTIELLLLTLPFLFGTLGIGLFSLVYAAAVLFLLHKFAGLRFEMQGRPIPIPTWQVTDYARLEKARAEKAVPPAAPSVVTEAKTKSPPYWTDFRGPNRDGHYTEQPLNLDWAKSPPKLLWKQPVGGGYASFVVADGLAFTLEQRRDSEAVTAYDVATGREVSAMGPANEPKAVERVAIAKLRRALEAGR